MYDELIKKYVDLIVEDEDRELYKIEVATLLQEFLAEAEKVHEKPRPAFNPRA
jgi:hypothetical protein